jgi:hypothetical protein
MRLITSSEVPGNRTLPAELRTPQHVPRGNAYGWHRLHQNLAPVTGGGVSGLGTDMASTMIPVDPIPMPPVHAPLPVYAGGGMPTYIQGLISQGLITPQYPPNKPAGSPSDAHLQHTPWGYIWAKVVKTSGGPVITWMNQPPGLAGLGQCYDPSAFDYNPADCAAPTDTGTSTGIPTTTPYQTPYPIVYSDGSTGVGTATDWATMLAASSNALTRTLAISQGGSVSPTGAIYGSPTTATAAAQAVPYGSLNIGAGGISGILSSPMILLLIGGLVLVTMSGKR